MRKRQEGYIKSVTDWTFKIDSEKSAYNYRQRGDVYWGENRFDEAIADYDAAIALDAKFRPAYFSRGRAFLDRNDSAKHDLDSAVTDFTTLIGFDSAYANAYLLRGRTFIEKSDFEKAKADLDEFIRLSPANPDGFKFRAKTYDGLGDKAKADQDRAKADELSAGGKQANQ